MTSRGANSHRCRVVATTEFRTARFPGTRKDDSGGRSPGSPARAASRAFPRMYLSGIRREASPATVAGTAAVRLRSLLALSGTACGHLSTARLCDNARRFRGALLRAEDLALIRYRVRLADLDRHRFEIECRIDEPGRRSSASRCRRGSPAATCCATSRATSCTSRPRAVASRWPSKRSAAGDVVRARRGPHADVHDHRLRARSVGARRVSRSAARLLQRAVRVRAARRAATRKPSRSRSSRRRTRCARTGASRRRSTPARSTSAASARTSAQDYDELLDHPVEIGEFESVEFEAAGVPHQLVVAGRFESDLERVAADLQQICTAQIEFFGAPAPFERYWFLGLGRRRRLRRSRASRVDEPHLQPRRPAEDRRDRPAARLPALSRAREPRVLSRLAREAQQAGRVHAVSARSAQPHAPAVGVRGHHELLPRAHAAAQRRHRRRPRSCSASASY